jgi:dihydroneopterin aldolase
MDAKDLEANDTIHIQGLEVYASVGTSEAERATRQRLAISVTMWPITKLTNLQDELARTIDYSAVAIGIKEFVADRSDKLIETLAEALARNILQQFQAQRVEIELRKFVLPDTEYVSVKLTRERTAG